MEKGDVWAGLTAAERDHAIQQEVDKVNGVVRYVEKDNGLRPFDDVNDPDNMGFLP